MKFSIKDFFSFLRICSHSLEKFLMENFIFCAVHHVKFPIHVRIVRTHKTHVNHTNARFTSPKNPSTHSTYIHTLFSRLFFSEAKLSLFCLEVRSSNQALYVMLRDAYFIDALSCLDNFFLLKAL